MPATSTSGKAPAGSASGDLGTGDHLDTPVRQIMTPGVVSIAEDASLRLVSAAMVAHSVHAVLVVGRTEGKPLGWVTARGLLAWVGRDQSLVSAHDAITERPEWIEPSATAREALSSLCQPGISHLMVCRQAGSMPEGVVSDRDLVALEGG